MSGEHNSITKNKKGYRSAAGVDYTLTTQAVFINILMDLIYYVSTTSVYIECPGDHLLLYLTYFTAFSTKILSNASNSVISVSRPAIIVLCILFKSSGCICLSLPITKLFY